jgi:hypothetical protein
VRHDVAEAAAAAGELLLRQSGLLDPGRRVGSEA